jgi:hypothetical protein
MTSFARQRISRKDLLVNYFGAYCNILHLRSAVMKRVATVACIVAVSAFMLTLGGCAKKVVKGSPVPEDHPAPKIETPPSGGGGPVQH